ncbi:hypothetical protein COEREDRAFT_12686, partial [Coemansia reversa NRRL 1564]
ILHRDISENNIIFRRDESGNVSGILIDFDNAVDSAAAQNDRRPICTGTLPFMSLNNLRRSDVPRTVVDDMESTLYLLIWLGVWGVTSVQRENTMDLDRMVSKWGTHIDDAVESKEHRMLSANTLTKLVDEFYNCEVETMQANTSEEYSMIEKIQVSYEMLKSLVLELRGAIFNNSLIPKTAHGTTIVRNSRTYNSSFHRRIEKLKGSMRKFRFQRSEAEPEPRDPFMERGRPENAQKIHAMFMTIFANYAELARSYIEDTDSIDSGVDANRDADHGRTASGDTFEMTLPSATNGSLEIATAPQENKLQVRRTHEIAASYRCDLKALARGLRQLYKEAAAKKG